MYFTSAYSSYHLPRALPLLYFAFYRALVGQSPFPSGGSGSGPRTQMVAEVWNLQVYGKLGNKSHVCRWCRTAFIEGRTGRCISVQALTSQAPDVCHDTGSSFFPTTVFLPDGGLLH